MQLAWLGPLYLIFVLEKSPTHGKTDQTWRITLKLRIHGKWDCDKTEFQKYKTKKLLLYVPVPTKYKQAISIYLFLFTGLLVIFLILILIITYDFNNRLKAKSHTFRTAFKQYLIIRIFRLFRGYIRKRLDADTSDVKSVQEKFLLDRLEESSETVYGKLFDFQNIGNREEYRRVHPLTRQDYNLSLTLVFSPANLYWYCIFLYTFLKEYL